MLNADLEDAALQQVHAAMDDWAVLEALTRYYRARPWDRRWLRERVRLSPICRNRVTTIKDGCSGG